MADKIIPGPGGLPIRLVDQGDGSFAQVMQVVGDQEHVRATVTMIGGSADVAVTTAAGYLQDTRASLTPNALIGKTIASNGKTGVITSNTAVRMNVAAWTGGTPAAGSGWAIVGNGAVGAIPLFDILGRIRVFDVAFYGDALVSAGGGTLEFGTTSVPDQMSSATLSVNGGTGWLTAGNAPQPSQFSAAAVTSLDIDATQQVVATVGTADITAGTLVVDMWISAVTDDGKAVPA